MNKKPEKKIDTSKPAKKTAKSTAAKPSKAQPENPHAWRSKIVGHDRVPPDQLVANPLNFRKHPQAQRDALKAAIEEVGFIRSVTVNKRTGNLIDGHERLWQAIATEQPFIDVEYVDLSEEDERKALATLDTISELAEVDPQILDQLLREVSTGSEALQEMLSQLAEESGSLNGDDEGGKPEAVIVSCYEVVVLCDSEADQRELFEKLKAEGRQCRVLTV